VKGISDIRRVFWEERKGNFWRKSPSTEIGLKLWDAPAEGRGHPGKRGFGPFAFSNISRRKGGRRGCKGFQAKNRVPGTKKGLTAVMDQLPALEKCFGRKSNPEPGEKGSDLRKKGGNSKEKRSPSRT